MLVGFLVQRVDFDSSLHAAYVVQIIPIDYQIQKRCLLRKPETNLSPKAADVFEENLPTGLLAL